MLLRTRVISRFILAASLLGIAACSDGTGPSRNQAMRIDQMPSFSTHTAEAFRYQPRIQIVDGLGSPVAHRGIVVYASLRAATASITNTTATTDSAGTAVFTGMSITGPPGNYDLVFHANGVGDDVTAAVTLTLPLCTGAVAGVPLDMPLGGFERHVTTEAGSPKCLEFHAAQSAGQQYLVLFENVAPNGDFKSALFTDASKPTSPSTLTINLSAAPATPAAEVALAGLMRNAKLLSSAPAPSEAPSSWNFGSGSIYEGTPPDASASAHVVMHSAAGTSMMVQAAVPKIGDTIEVTLAGIPRLNTTEAVQRAVVRFISDDLIFADDIRLSNALTRSNGANNTPLTIAQMDTIAREYAAYGKVQSNKFFQGRYNAATEAQSSHVTVVHTLMYDDNIWGYSYPNSNYFAFDFWVKTDGRTRGNNQVLQRVSDDLFMHEISHIRHYGMLERATPTRVTKRGNQWLTEGFARSMERLPIAMRLLGTRDLSRTSNFVLARNPVFTGGAYFLDDVPTYLNAGSSVFDGYQSSSYLFDYFADQVALRGGDYQAAVRDLLLNGGVDADLNAAVSRWLPGMKFGELLTRARVALYTDDSNAGLPEWTQYTQYQLRASRPPESQASIDADPRNAWPKVTAGAVYTQNRSLAPGSAFGYVIDGTGNSADSRIVVNATAAANVVVSITRIR